MVDHLLLPPELWLEILRYATASEREQCLIQPIFVPFEPANHTENYDPAIITKRSVVLVCREWNQLTTEFLYENLRIWCPTRCTSSLRQVLLRAGLGASVRRVVLPYTITSTPDSKGIPTTDILRLCPRIETLVRPRTANPGIYFHFDAEEAPFLSLQRLDWWYDIEAERSGGINSLTAVLHNAPNIRYLSVGSALRNSHILMNPSPLLLPKLQTLRLQWSNAVFLRRITQQWSLPSLRQLAVDHPLPEPWLTEICGAFGVHLQVLEFGKHVQFLLKDHISTCLQECHNLVELNYYVFFADPPRLETPHPALTTVRLHASVNELLTAGGNAVKHVQEHFTVLTRRREFPALKEIFLYGNWDNIISEVQLSPILQSLEEHQITLQLVGRPVTGE